MFYSGCKHVRARAGCETLRQVKQCTLALYYRRSPLATEGAGSGWRSLKDHEARCLLDDSTPQRVRRTPQRVRRTPPSAGRRDT
ncbi:hypothetical protein EYF80_064871 [Liparis tanakae]|uniref:Uncharacterized protein n=1 Tax=Liparis tanakae TaxID=230148 RepID=A0A4Z2E9R1_9TELE|nr:hypothetical protein EYF80_064871 [Liparis tanakae]